LKNLRIEVVNVTEWSNTIPRLGVTTERLESSVYARLCGDNVRLENIWKRPNTEQWRAR